MIAGIDIMAWLAGSYGLLLLAVAWGIDLAARRTAQHTDDWRSGAFTYHEDHDAWRCPEDQWLWPQSFDPKNRVMRYRASPLICNSCPVKDTCTTSETGREVSRNVDPWPSSEAERFHRGIACYIVVLAMLWPAIALLTAGTAVERMLLAGVLVAVVVASLPLWSHLRRSPADFPVHVPVEELDETVVQQEELAQTLRGRRATYGSDSRGDGGDGSGGDAAGRPPVGSPGRTGTTTPLPTPTIRYASDRGPMPAEQYQPGFPVRRPTETRSS